jgi:hypothetical protein
MRLQINFVQKMQKNSNNYKQNLKSLVCLINRRIFPLETLLFSLAKNCRILQFKLRKAEKRNETMETEKDVLEGKTSIYFHRNSNQLFFL